MLKEQGLNNSKQKFLTSNSIIMELIKKNEFVENIPIKLKI